MSQCVLLPFHTTEYSTPSSVSAHMVLTVLDWVCYVIGMGSSIETQLLYHRCLELKLDSSMKISQAPFVMTAFMKHLNTHQQLSTSGLIEAMGLS